MSKVKVIAMKQDASQGFVALASSALFDLLVLDIVSLLSGGVLRPFMPEW